jgi:hypothetical protein
MAAALVERAPRLDVRLAEQARLTSLWDMPEVMFQLASWIERKVLW